MLRSLFVKFQNTKRKLFDKDALALSEISKSGNHKNVFNFIYEKKYWQSSESVSGWGSTMGITEPLRPKLEKLLSDLKVKSFLDVPCGDFNWMKAVNFGDIKYIGGDIVPGLVDELNKKYADSKRSFMLLDVVSDKLPEVDVIFIRDCFIHLENSLVLKALENIANSNISYAVITHAPNTMTNMNIETGQFRDINLCKAPFNLPAPDMVINEGCVDPLLVDKSLGVWKVSGMRSKS